MPWASGSGLLEMQAKDARQQIKERRRDRQLASSKALAMQSGGHCSGACSLDLFDVGRVKPHHSIFGLRHGYFENSDHYHKVARRVLLQCSRAISREESLYFLESACANFRLDRACVLVLDSVRPSVCSVGLRIGGPAGSSILTEMLHILHALWSSRHL